MLITKPLTENKGKLSPWLLFFKTWKILASLHGVLLPG